MLTNWQIAASGLCVFSSDCWFVEMPTIPWQSMPTIKRIFSIPFAALHLPTSALSHQGQQLFDCCTFGFKIAIMMAVARGPQDFLFVRSEQDWPA